MLLATTALRPATTREGQADTHHRWKALFTPDDKFVGIEVTPNVAANGSTDDSGRWDLSVSGMHAIATRVIGEAPGKMLYNEPVHILGAGREFYCVFHKNGYFSIVMQSGRIMQFTYPVVRLVHADVRKCSNYGRVVSLETDQGIFYSPDARVCAKTSEFFRAAGPDPNRSTVPVAPFDWALDCRPRL